MSNNDKQTNNKSKNKSKLLMMKMIMTMKKIQTRKKSLSKMIWTKLIGVLLHDTCSKIPRQDKELHENKNQQMKWETEEKFEAEEVYHEEENI